MKSFRQFLAAVRESEEAPPLGDLGTDTPEDVLLRIARIIIREHKEDLVTLAESLAERDDKLKDEVRAYRQAERGGGLTRPRTGPGLKVKPEKEVIVPSTADSGYATG